MFSRRVEDVAEQLVRLRIHVEAAIDFADEPLDTLGVHLGCVPVWSKRKPLLTQLRLDARQWPAARQLACTR